MCTAVTYKTKDFYFGRTLDYEFSYKEEVIITPRNYPFYFKEKEETDKNKKRTTNKKGGIICHKKKG